VLAVGVELLLDVLETVLHVWALRGDAPVQAAYREYMRRSCAALIFITRGKIAC
jgi:hypothetical protein